MREGPELGFWACIPARRASSRLPNKPLADLGGRPMILRTAEVATQSGAQRVVIATDDVEILSVVQSAGFEAFMTSPHHTSGTDRLAELAERLEAPDDQVLVNLQGDEPLMPPEVLRQVAQRLLGE
ncbi:MAG: 3-deoxy-manno-octulosonate cytidylyltransferase, partial [Betaproteobacteria bacterium]|nr:3-deoxy-manno-octulosonate cytidylyltransferase [Betaproteobacteria bacterium]